MAYEQTKDSLNSLPSNRTADISMLLLTVSDSRLVFRRTTRLVGVFHLIDNVFKNCRRHSFLAEDHFLNNAFTCYSKQPRWFLIFVAYMFSKYYLYKDINKSSVNHEILVENVPLRMSNIVSTVLI